MRWVEQHDTACWMWSTWVKNRDKGWHLQIEDNASCCSLWNDKNKKTTAWWRSVSCLHLTSTNRYTTCGDSIRKPLAADRLRANCCLRGIQKWEDSMYKDKNTPRNPSTNNILYKDRKLSCITLSRLRLVGLFWPRGRHGANHANLTSVFSYVI